MPYNYLTRNFPVAAFLSSLLLVSPSVAQDAAKNGSNDGLPEILRSIELQGIRILGEMDVPGGLRGFAAKAGAQPIAIYLTPDCWFPRGTEPVFPPRSEPPLSMVF
ncbi:hypothetical protein O9X90_22405 [Agrobacterium leguminum]|uniref:hypothetical protein n=1 Tax=Agrobacterium leguminum TaxID=2792015 RepID=UPI0022B83FF1|nr:hypothetical protein [Agrobacterium leguminum]MCZ7935083.1 hypothetical protein [Agrobacterium leguminum]